MLGLKPLSHKTYLLLLVISVYYPISSTLIFATDSDNIGERISKAAERFIGTPYDPDPIGTYVRKKVLVYDEEVDCMYLTFRAVELALSKNPKEAKEIALEKRFFTKGILSPDGMVLNYEDRYQYGEDMIDSGKFGEEITSALGKTILIEGSRGRKIVPVIPKSEISNIIHKFLSGDIIFFVKAPDRRVYDEIVGHIGIIKVEDGQVYLIHASGRKNGKGMVVKIPFPQYVNTMDFIGIRVTRFKDP